MLFPATLPTARMRRASLRPALRSRVS